MNGWKWVFFLKAIAVILRVVGDFFVLVMLSRASLDDRQNRVHGDLLHRCGVINQIALSLLTVFLTVFFMLSFSWAVAVMFRSVSRRPGISDPKNVAA